MVDLIFVVIILAFALFGARRGFFGALAGLFGTLLSYLVAAKAIVPALSPAVAGWIAPYCERMLLQAAGEEWAGAVEQPLDQIGQGLGEMLENMHLPAELADSVLQAADGGQTVLAAATQAVSQAVAPVIAFVIGFLLCKLALWALACVLGSHLPVVRTLNKGAGLLLGLVGGLAVVAALCVGIRAFAPQGVGGVFSLQSVEQSYIGGLVYGLLPGGPALE